MKVFRVPWSHLLFDAVPWPGDGAWCFGYAGLIPRVDVVVGVVDAKLNPVM